MRGGLRCRRVQREIPRLDELGTARRRRVEVHARSCAACRPILETHRQLAALAEAAADEYAALTASRPAPSPRREATTHSHPAFGLRLSVAVGLILLAVTAVLVDLRMTDLGRRSSPSEPQPSASELTPAVGVEEGVVRGDSVGTAPTPTSPPQASNAPALELHDPSQVLGPLSTSRLQRALGTVRPPPAPRAPIALDLRMPPRPSGSLPSLP